MKLSTLFENKNLAKVKDSEIIFQQEFLNFIGSKINPEKYGTEIEEFLKLYNLQSPKSIESLGKPSAKNAKYGSSAEPKTDFSFKIDNKVFNISFKNGNNYIFSAGSPKEFQGICDAALEILELNYPNRVAEFKHEIISDISKIISYIGKTRKGTYTKNQLKNKEVSWFKEIDYEENENSKFALDNRQLAINTIQKHSEDNPNEYKDFLKLAEQTVKEVVTKILNENSCFAKCFFFETYSGIWKFGGDGIHTKFDNISPSANTVIQLGKGVFEITSTESPIVVLASENFGVRLQNVPRGNARRFISRASEETRNLKFLIDCLTEIELSLKIGADKNRKISEFVEPEINIQNLERAIMQASFSEILKAFDLQIEVRQN